MEWLCRDTVKEAQIPQCDNYFLANIVSQQLIVFYELLYNSSLEMPPDNLVAGIALVSLIIPIMDVPVGGHGVETGAYRINQLLTAPT